MKSPRYLWALLVLFSTTGVTTSALASGTKTVVVTNNTSYTVNAFYASPSDTAGWDTSNNLLAGQTVAPGQAATITIADGLGECTYDLMAILYGIAQYAYQYQVDACGGGIWNIAVPE